MNADTKKERLAIYGGTFSPPHLGHRKAAETLLAALNPDRLLVIPTFLPPHKSISTEHSPAHRFRMTELCFADLPNTEVSDLEIRRTGKSYTFDTLTELSREDREIFFLCGTDMLLSFENWHRFRDIFDLCTLVLQRREQDRALDEEVRDTVERFRTSYGAKILEIPIDPIVLSSTDVRNAVRAGASHADLCRLVPESVADYIEANQLYLTETEAEDI